MYQRLLRRTTSSLLDLRKLRANRSTLSLVADPRIQIYEDCILQVRTKIFRREDDKIAILSDLLTISRSLEFLLPSILTSGQFSLPNNDTEHIARLGLPFNELASYCRSELRQIQSTRSTMNFNPSRMGPVDWRPQPIPESERVIAPPVTLKVQDRFFKLTTGSKSEFQLGLLVLKLAEMMLEVDKLEEEFLYWYGVFSSVKVRQSSKIHKPLVNHSSTVSKLMFVSISILGIFMV